MIYPPKSCDPALGLDLRTPLWAAMCGEIADPDVLQDILTGDEVMSDSYDIKEIDGAVFEVDCQMITLGAVEVSTYTPPPGQDNKR